MMCRKKVYCTKVADLTLTHIDVDLVAVVVVVVVVVASAAAAVVITSG